MPNIKRTLILFTCLFSICLSAQLKVSGINVPLVFNSGENALILNGAGVRVKYFMDMYVGALYLKNKSGDAARIMEADEAMCMQLQIVSGLITSEKMNEAVDEGFKKSTGGNTNSLQARINQFKAVFNEKITKGDVYQMVYQKNKGTQIYKNGKLSCTIPGLDFKTALFGIWLCRQPADSGLKQKLLNLD
ncbi:MAG TPA: chalcone isomerase family protein [Bacteroidia bacterium]|nr:chalcone isomerase family protein [Bacteroidia bacterium]